MSTPKVVNGLISWSKYKNDDEDMDEMDNYQVAVLKYWAKNGREGFNAEFDDIFRSGCCWGTRFEEAIENGNAELASEIFEEFNKRKVDIRGPIWESQGDHAFIDFDCYFDRLFTTNEFKMPSEEARFKVLDLLFKITGWSPKTYEYTNKWYGGIYGMYMKHVAEKLEVKE
jgi:hypothetical protein